MKIETIEIKNYSASELELFSDGIIHQKNLPCLSIVQALEGTYGIRLDDQPEYFTGTMGAFIAPKGRTQFITHILDAETKSMRSHWVFLYVLINDTYQLDDVFDFPVILPSQYNQILNDTICSLKINSNLCDNLSILYKLIKILIEIGTPKKAIDPKMHEIQLFVNQNYPIRVSPAEIANQFSISVPTLFRKFKEHFNLTPSNYLNSVRLAHASMILEMTKKSISQIAQEVGIDDVYYFSKLFKKKYGVSPLKYRNRDQKTNKTLP